MCLTSTSQKKHYHQMRMTEKTVIKTLLKKIPKFTETSHLIDRLKEKDISYIQVLEAIAKGKIIEYHNKNGSNRVLIRGNKQYEGRNVCAVIDIYTGRIITAYVNSSTDIHSTIDWKNYNENLDILKAIKQSSNNQYINRNKIHKYN